MNNDRITICRKIKLIPLGDKEERNRAFQYISWYFLPFY